MAQTFHRLYFSNGFLSSSSHSISIYLFTTWFTLKYCANNRSERVRCLNLEFLNAFCRIHLSQQRERTKQSQIKIERKRENFLHAWTTFTTLCVVTNSTALLSNYYLKCLHPSVFCTTALVFRQKNHSLLCHEKRQITILV